MLLPLTYPNKPPKGYLIPIDKELGNAQDPLPLMFPYRRTSIKITLMALLNLFISLAIERGSPSLM